MDIVERIKETKIVGIARKVPVGHIADMARALYAGGIRNLEVTFNHSSPSCIPDAVASIEAIKLDLGDKMLVGAGTVVTVEQTKAAHGAGADFILSPDTNVSVINMVKRLGMVSIPGALTPTEILSAWNAGADIVKVFPAGLMGVPYVKAIRGPISQIPLMAVGNVDTTNIKELLANGYCSCGIGSNLVRNDLILSEKWKELTDVARLFVSLILSEVPMKKGNDVL